MQPGAYLRYSEEVASTYRKLRARALKGLFHVHARIYELSGGRLGAQVGLPMLLLTVTGRTSGLPRSTPLAYFRDADAYVVVGSDGGARRDPQWWRNLQVDPRATVRVGRRVIEVRARLAEGEQRARLWERGRAVNPAWERYQRTTARSLPVVLLEPTVGAAPRPGS